jgi:hypothetical protein
MTLRAAFAFTFSSYLLSIASAFVSFAPQNKFHGLFSTVDDAMKEEALIFENSLTDDEEWLTKQFHALDEIDLPGQTLSVAAKLQQREYDWFSDALTRGRQLSLEGLQIEASNGKPTTSSFFSGIQPDIPPLAPSFQSLQAYRMEPLHPEPATRHTKDSFEGGKMEWFLQSKVDPFPANAVANHNHIKDGSNEWFMQALCEL